MELEIYHQLGHNHNWNFESISEDETGNGVILAPRYLNRDKIENLSAQIKNKAIFDPQFFFPDVSRGKLASYDFFPDIASDGFETADYIVNFASDCAQRCITFQLNNDFRYLIIPTRRMEGMPSDFIERQTSQFVTPFLEVLAANNSNKRRILQLILNNNMIMDDAYIADILNWITGYEMLDGVYLIVETSFGTKQIKDADYLYHLLRTIRLLRDNELDVILGYLNTEALLLSIASPTILTMGTYENLRKFNIGPFDDRESGQQRGPRPRLYLSKLLQSIDHGYIGAIRRRIRNHEDLFDHNRYRAEIFHPTFHWHFSKPQLYKHQLLEFSKQLSYVNRVSGEERYKAIRELMANAIGEHQRLENAGIHLDTDSDGSHIYTWLTALDEYATDMGWRK